MTRLITLTTKSASELSGKHEKFVNALSSIAKKINSPAVGVDELRKSNVCRTLKPKRFRAIVRQLAAAKFIKIKRVN